MEGSRNFVECESSSKSFPVDPKHSAKVARMREVVNDQAMSRWDVLWLEDVTPWDLGRVTPLVASLVQEGKLPTGRALVAGCGSGYDVVAFASPDRHVVGLDISETCIARARALASGAANGKYTEFVVHDFFAYSASVPFDLIFDYTFFTALEPSLRPLWAKKMGELIAPNGLLITLMFPIGEFCGGPPYAVSVEAYNQVLQPLGFNAELVHENELSVGGRKGREMVGFWRKGGSKM